MRYKSIISIALCLTLITCTSGKKKFGEEFYKIPSSAWKGYLTKIGVNDTTLSHTVWLIMHPTACSPCMKELDWWNKHGNDYENVRVSLIVIEKYEKTFQAFLNKQHVSLPSFRDSTALALIKDLVPTTPVKIYFNEKANIVAIDHMGEEGNLPSFINQIKR